MERDGLGIGENVEHLSRGHRGIIMSDTGQLEAVRAPTSAAALVPIQQSERIDSIDVLRGIAVLGILLMNIQSFSMIGAAYFNPMCAGEPTPANWWTWAIVHVIADQ